MEQIAERPAYRRSTGAQLGGRQLTPHGYRPESEAVTDGPKPDILCAVAPWVDLVPTDRAVERCYSRFCSYGNTQRSHRPL